MGCLSINFRETRDNESRDSRNTESRSPRIEHRVRSARWNELRERDSLCSDSSSGRDSRDSRLERELRDSRKGLLNGSARKKFTLPSSTRSSLILVQLFAGRMIFTTCGVWFSFNFVSCCFCVATFFSSSCLKFPMIRLVFPIIFFVARWRKFSVRADHSESPIFCLPFSSRSFDSRFFGLKQPHVFVL